MAIHGADDAGRAATRPSTTTTARSWSRRWPTGWPRRSPSTSTCKARRDWFEPDAEPDLDDLHAERFRGIRPALGYPASPDHSEKQDLFDLLDAARLGIGADRVVRDDPGRQRQRPDLRRTPASRYFTVGRIGKDQVERLRGPRAGMPVAEVERWLRPNLAYEID